MLSIARRRSLGLGALAGAGSCPGPDVTIALFAPVSPQIDGKPLVVLPRKSVNLVTVHLTREDRAKYDA